MYVFIRNYLKSIFKIEKRFQLAKTVCVIVPFDIFEEKKISEGHQKCLKDSSNNDKLPEKLIFGIEMDEK